MLRKEWIKIPQAAEIIKVAEKTVRRRIKAKRYHSKRVKGKFGPVILVLLEDVMKDVQGSESIGQPLVSEETTTVKDQSPGQTQSGSDEDSSEESTPLTVLIADESDEILKLIAGILEEQGINTITAHDGREALEMIRNQKPDAVIVEPALPIMDGFQLAAEMEADTDISHVPIVFCSYHKVRSIINQGLSYKNAVRYFTKPLLGKQLKELKRFIHRREWMKKEN